ncbi:hypothetical protein [Duganella sp. FT27W]|uniref:nucleotide-binding protein n=1 Tax=Duganella sp. FT27W TaxID=2654636 RepID=UPI00128DFA6D|nr:hypothetical protein [Duganella sp. FT27W]
MTVISIFSGAGGSGRTTLAVGLAAYFAKSGRATALLDVNYADNQVAVRWAEKIAGTASSWSFPTIGYPDGDVAAWVKAHADELDVVVVDGTNYDGVALRTALALSNMVLVPVESSGRAMEAAAFLVPLIVAARETNPGLKAYTVVADITGKDYEGDPGHAIAELPELENVITSAWSFDDAMDLGHTVFDRPEYDDAAEQIIALATEVERLI